MKHPSRKASTPKAPKRKRVAEDAVDLKVPRTIVVARGVSNAWVKRLKQDIRTVFLPNTAQKIKERKFNKTRDFLDVCGPLGVSHVLALFSTDTSLNLKLVKVPQVCAPVILGYSLIHSIQRAHQKSFDIHNSLKSGPLVVMTNFQKSKHHELLVTLLQNMFPAVNPQSTEMKNKRRVVLFDYDAEENLIHFRHYQISIPPSGMNKGMKALIYSPGAPDLGDCISTSDFITKSGNASESEGEDMPDSRVQLPGGKTKEEPTTRRVKLHEIGPRMDLMLHKIEQGLMDGMVLYNRLVDKSMEEVAETARRREAHAQLKAMRRKEQEKRVEKKRKEKEERKKKNKNVIPREVVSDDDDAAYYLEEVGTKPDAHFGIRSRGGGINKSAKKKPRR